MADTTASQLRRFYAALQETQIYDRENIRIALIVTVENGFFFETSLEIGPSARARLWETELLPDPSLEWVPENQRWFCTALDEVYPCEWASRSNRTYHPPQFELLDLYHDDECEVRQAALTILASWGDFIHTTIYDHRVQLAQDLVQSVQSYEELREWGKGIEVLMRTASEGKGVMAELLTKHIANLCRGIIDGTEGSLVLDDQPGEKRQKEAQDMMEYYAYTRLASLRAEAYNAMVRVLLNVTRQLLATLFSKGEEIPPICDIVSADHLVYQFTDRILKEFFPSDRGAFLRIGPSRLSVQDLRTRQHLLARASHEKGAQRSGPGSSDRGNHHSLITTRLPFSFMFYQLLPLETTERYQDSIYQLLCDCSEPEYAERYLHDAIVFLIETYIEVKEKDGSFEEGTRWLMMALVILLHHQENTETDILPRLPLGDAAKAIKVLFDRHRRLVLRFYRWAWSVYHRDGKPGNHIQQFRNGSDTSWEAICRQYHDYRAFMVAVSNANASQRPSLQEVFFIQPHLTNEREKWVAKLQTITYFAFGHTDPSSEAFIFEFVRTVSGHLVAHHLASLELCQGYLAKHLENETLTKTLVPVLYHLLQSEGVIMEYAPWFRLFSSMNVRHTLVFHPSLLQHTAEVLLEEYLSTDKGADVPFSHELAPGSLTGGTQLGVLLSYATFNVLLRSPSLQAGFDKVWTPCVRVMQNHQKHPSLWWLACCVAVGGVQALLHQCQQEEDHQYADQLWRKTLPYLLACYQLWQQRSTVDRVNALQIGSAPFLLAMRVFSSNGLEMEKAREKILVLQQISRNTTDRAVRHLMGIRGNDCLKAFSKLEGLPPDKLDVLIELTEYIDFHLSDTPELQHVPPCRPELKKLCDALIHWTGLMKGANFPRWDTNSCLCLAAIVFYCLLVEPRQSYLNRLVTGEEVYRMGVTDLGGPVDSSVEECAARLVRACAAFGAALVRDNGNNVDQKALHTAAQLKNIPSFFLFPHCPSCGTAFIDYDGCAALACSTCNAHFCALCFHSTMGDVHPHVLRCPLNKHSGYFINKSNWKDIFVRHSYGPKLTALLDGATHASVGNRDVDILAEGAKNQPFPKDVILAHRTLFRYVGMRSLKDSEFWSGMTQAQFLQPETLTPPTIHPLTTPIEAREYALCFEVLHDALQDMVEVEAVRKVFGRSKSFAPVLTYLFGLLSSNKTPIKKNSANHLYFDLDLTSHFNIGKVYENVSKLASGVDKVHSDLEKSIRWDRDYAHQLRAKGVQEMYLFDPFVPRMENRVAVSQLCEKSRFVKALESYSGSFTKETASDTQRVLCFSCDARTLVRETKMSRREVKGKKLAWLTTRDPVVFPEERVMEFITSATRMLTSLSRADNRCNNDQGQYTINAADSDPNRIDLEECLYLADDDKSNLINVLFTGTNHEHTAVGYGNADSGQNAVLAQYRHSLSAVEDALLMDIEDFMVYDTAWTEQIASLHSSTGLHVLEEDWEHPSYLTQPYGTALVEGAVYHHPGVMGCPTLGSLVQLDFNTTPLHSAMNSLFGYLDESTEEINGPRWETNLRALVKRLWEPSPQYQQDICGFLLEYIRYHASLFTAASGGEYYPRATRTKEPTPLPPFSSVPSDLLTKGQRSAQAQLEDLRLPPRDTVLLFVELFQSKEFHEEPQAEEKERVERFLEEFKQLADHTKMWQVYVVFKISLIFAVYAITDDFGTMSGMYSSFKYCLINEAMVESPFLCQEALPWIERTLGDDVRFGCVGTLIKRMNDEISNLVEIDN